jgi:SAM-dependent methyltransferase
MSSTDVKELVKERYGEAARVVRCGAGDATPVSDDPVTRALYDDADAASVPVEALQASLGCGNPTALAKLKEGDVVLDLGSGGGIDVLLSARRVGPTGKAYGLDMTDEMLVLAEENKARSGLRNVEFLRGEIEEIPLPDGSVDVIISNCVLNLSTDKDRALAEAFRVLRPDGRVAISDIVLSEPLPVELRANEELWADFWTECFSGALEQNEYREKLAAAGFAEIEVQPTRVFGFDDAYGFLAERTADAEQIARAVEGKVMSAFVRAVKP